jgi:uncharacterized membrane protein
MPVVISIHTLATIVWLGALFFICVVFRPGARGLDRAIALPLWDRVLARFFVWASIGMTGILVSGIVMVFLKFGGFSGVPILHRANTALGIPAVVLYGYLCFGPWRRFRSAMSAADSIGAEKSLGQFWILTALILSLGFLASIVSVAGRYM